MEQVIESWVVQSHRRPAVGQFEAGDRADGPSCIKFGGRCIAFDFLRLVCGGSVRWGLGARVPQTSGRQYHAAVCGPVWCVRVHAPWTQCAYRATYRRM